MHRRYKQEPAKKTPWGWLRKQKLLRERQNIYQMRQGEADKARAEAMSMKPLARLGDLHLWQMEKTKTTKK